MMEDIRMAGYLFVHFIGEGKDGEQVYFSLSRDGLHWTDLNGGKPVLYSQIGTCGVRDPYLVHNSKNGMYYLIATDLRIASGEGWTKAQEAGSRDLIVWESKDLVHWSRERACTVGISGAGCVWAPEAVFDRKKGAFFVFFASKVKTAGDVEGKHRIYGTFTKDFRKFSETFLYFEKENHVIDTTILESGGRYYRISKDETSKRLIMESSDSLLGEYVKVESSVLDALEGVEGPEGYLLPDGKTWCLIADQFQAVKGYLPMVSENIGKEDFRILSPEEYDMGRNRKRHGGVIRITDEEYEELMRFYGGENPVLEGLYADPDLYYENGTYFLYPTTDGYPHWSGNIFNVFTSADGMHFQKAAQILDVASGQVPWAMGYAWAPCLVKKGDTYYFYFCAKGADGRSCIGAASARSPLGPFRAEDEPMVTLDMMEECGIRMAQTIDPSVYREGEDYYFVFGNGSAAVAKLTEDMLHIRKETLKNIEGLADFRESLIVVKRGSTYHFTWSCDDTGSEDYHVNYGISDSLYGPVEYLYPILQKDVRRGILGTGHHSICKMPDEERYIIAYHRFGTPIEKYPEGKGWHREVCLAPLTFGDDGKIMPVTVV